MMKKTFFVLLFLLPFSTYAQITPVTTRPTSQGTIISLSRYIKKAIRQFDSSFVPLSTKDYVKSLREKKFSGNENCLSVCTGDFDGNGLKDVALLGRSAGGMRLITAFQNSKNSFSVKGVKEFPFFESGEEDAYLQKNPARALNVTFDNRTISFDNDTFMLTYYRRGNIIYRWDGKAFIQYQLGH